MISLVTIAAALTAATQNLLPYSATPRLDAEVLLTHLLQVNTAYCFSHAQQLLAQDVLISFQQLIVRRQQGEPIAYLTGYKEFWSLTLQVTPAVLIPRPETELLVELALQLLPENEPIQVADLGTGSGAVALALAYERPQWRITATDQSVSALHIAQQNAQRLGITNIQFLLGHWCQALPTQGYAAIISNPPYIAAYDIHLAALTYEPQSALIASDEGYADIEQIIAQAPHYLATNGLLLLEHGYNQGLNVVNKLCNAGFDNVKIFKDLAELERVTVASWK